MIYVGIDDTDEARTLTDRVSQKRPRKPHRRPPGLASAKRQQAAALHSAQRPFSQCGGTTPLWGTARLVSRGPGGANPHKTAHYALCTGFMALGMMLPGMVSGWLQQQLGYTQFFVWVCLATLPSVAVAPFLRIPPDFGRKQAGAEPG